jgi:hypothetical protein
LDCEAIMGHTLIHPFATAHTPRRVQLAGSDDSLDAIRGILFGAAISLLGFWLPLALILAG